LLCVLVLPLPRSGSSMIGGILQQLGVAMGPCQPPDAANPLGYFEDVRFTGLHRAWSRRYETNPKRARLKLPPWDPQVSEVDLSRYARLIRICKRQPQWGVKDPELCYYARHFTTVLRQPIRVIATTRNPEAAAASLGARRPFSPVDCAMIIEEYTRRQALTLDALVAHGDAPALRIDYDEALADPDGTVRRIAEHIDLPVTATATAFVVPKLRRHQSDQPADTRRNADQGVTTLTM
jgi:hypothetical protein